MRRAHLVYPPAIWPPTRILVRGDDQSAPLAGLAGRVSLVISDYRVCLVFVVAVLGVFRRVPQELSFLFAILRSEVRPNAHSTPRVRGVVQAPVAVRAQSDIPGGRCERGEAGAGESVAGSRARLFFLHNTSFRLKPQVIICCPVLGAASSRRAPVGVGGMGEESRGPSLPRRVPGANNAPTPRRRPAPAQAGPSPAEPSPPPSGPEGQAAVNPPVPAAKPELSPGLPRRVPGASAVPQPRPRRADADRRSGTMPFAWRARI